MSNLMVLNQAKRLAEYLSIEGDAKELIDTLKATAFKVKDGVVSDAQMTALMIVAQQYGLNPWVRQIYAFPDKQAGIVPVVGVDGWLAIINKHPEYDGCEFTYAEQMVTPEGGKECPIWCECKIYRKDRTRPIVVREYLDEVYRPPFQAKGSNGQPYTANGPWQSHTKRFLRHKVLIQCSRIAFGFSGIYDEDEAEGFIDKPTEKEINPIQGKAEPENRSLTFDETVAKVQAATIDNWNDWLDVKPFTKEQKHQLSKICTAKRKQLEEMRVVATQHKEPEPAAATQAEPEQQQGSGVDWLGLIESSKDNKAMMAVASTIPDAEMVDVIISIDDNELLNRFYKALPKEKQIQYNQHFDTHAQFLETGE